MKIGITDPMGTDERYQSYARWIGLHAPHAELVRLSHRLGNAAEAELCDGIILTGGGDVDPSLYRGPAHHPALTGVDPERDGFEQKVIAGILARPRPFLGICRGMQLTNVALGGTLVTDVEESGFPSHRSPAGMQALHPVVVAGSGLLGRAGGAPQSVVNTYHHQAVEKVAPGLRAAAVAADGVIEALEMDDAEEFFLLVQWHPERMEDQSSPCAGGIAALFLEHVSHYAQQHHILP